MFQKISLTGFIVLLLTLGACHRDEQISEEAQIGKINFQGYGCTTCHRVGGQGGVLGPDLTFVGFRKSPEWLDLWLQNPPGWKHNTLMPNFYLKDHVRKSIVAYLSTLKGEAYRQGTPPWNVPELMDDPVKRGEVLYTSVGCMGCHGPAGKGGSPNNNVVGGLIPSLVNVADGFSEPELADKIRKGSHPQPEKAGVPEPMIYMPTWGQVLKDDEIQAIVKYLYSLRPKRSATESWE